jgi:hypothetical protein
MNCPYYGGFDGSCSSTSADARKIGNSCLCSLDAGCGDLDLDKKEASLNCPVYQREIKKKGNCPFLVNNCLKEGKPCLYVDSDSQKFSFNAATNSCQHLSSV